MTIESRIKQLYRSQGLSQKQFADSIGLTQSAVSQWVTGGTYPTLPTLAKIAQFFEITLAELFNGVTIEEVK